MLLERTARDQSTVRAILAAVRSDGRTALSAPDILHKTEAGGVLLGVAGGDTMRAGFDRIVANAKAYKSDAVISGVQVQQRLPSGAQEVIVGAVTDPSFGKLVAFGLGGILVEVLKDVTFRLAPASRWSLTAPCRYCRHPKAKTS